MAVAKAERVKNEKDFEKNLKKYLTKRSRCDRIEKLASEASERQNLEN